MSPLRREAALWLGAAALVALLVFAWLVSSTPADVSFHYAVQ